MKEMKLVWILNSLKIRAWKQSKCSSVEECVVYAHNGILFCHEREGNPAICSHIAEPGRCYVSEISQLQKCKYCMIPLIGVI